MMRPSWPPVPVTTTRGPSEGEPPPNAGHALASLGGLLLLLERVGGRRPPPPPSPAPGWGSSAPPSTRFASSRGSSSSGLRLRLRLADAAA